MTFDETVGSVRVTAQREDIVSRGTPALVGVSARPTQRDVAQRAGVSQATVSHVLRGHDSSVSPATRRRVLAALSEVAYAPNALAQALRGVKTTLYGMIVRNLSHPTISCMVEAVCGAARENGYNVLIADAGRNAADALRVAALMKGRLCDGVILLGDLPDQDQLWDGYGELGLPAVGLMQGSVELPVPNVSIDNALGTEIALSHLYELGHRRIAFVNVTPLQGARERLERYELFRSERSLDSDPSLVLGVGHGPAAGAMAAKKLLSLRKRPTAVLAATDETAIGILAWAAQSGVPIPDHLSVVGFDDSPHAEFTVPPLTTVRQPMKEIVERAIQLISQGVSHPASLYLIPPVLIVRKSTCSVR